MAFIFNGSQCWNNVLKRLFSLLKELMKVMKVFRPELKSVQSRKVISPSQKRYLQVLKVLEVECKTWQWNFFKRFRSFWVLANYDSSGLLESATFKILQIRSVRFKCNWFCPQIQEPRELHCPKENCETVEGDDSIDLTSFNWLLCLTCHKLFVWFQISQVIHESLAEDLESEINLGWWTLIEIQFKILRLFLYYR